MQNRIQKVVKHPLISGSTIIFVGTFLANIINYLFNLMMGRMLSVADYGLLSSLSSLFILSAIFAIAFGNVITRFIATYNGNDNKQGEQAVLLIGTKYVTIFSTLILFMLIMLSPLIGKFLHVSNNIFVILIAFSSFFTLMLSLPQGFIQGKMRFLLLSVITILQPVLKLIVAVVLLLLGYSILGPFIGILVGGALPTVMLYYYIFRNLVKKRQLESFNEQSFKKEFIHSSYTFFLSGIGITILQNTDIMLVRHFFGPYESGLYAALSLMGKAIFYFTSPINAVFFPLIAFRKERKQRLFHVVVLASGLIAGLSTAMSFVYFAIPEVVIKIFFPSSSYQDVGRYLGFFSLYILAFSLVFLFNNFYLSIGRMGVYKVTLFAALLQVILILFIHQTIFHIIAILFSISLLLLISFLIYYLLYEKD